MFQSYEYIKHLGYDPKVNQYKWEYKIIDSDFEHIGVTAAVPFVRVRVVAGDMLAFGVAVIDTYSQRGLPVAPNLIRALLWYQDQYGVTLDQMIKWHKKYNLRWPEVEKDMQKYLLFS